jgi:DNA repair protein SbcD/Mre11
MKFAHMADVHIGGWREPKMASLGIDAFTKSIDECLLQNIDFLIISGDLFNTSVPNIDYIKLTIKQLKRLKSNNIPVYIVPGSHDFSPSGKTMLDVLEDSDFLINVLKSKKLDDGNFQLLFTYDKKTSAKLSGMLGKKNMLEKSYYKVIDYSNLESEQGFKIFLFHTALDELKPSDLSNMESSPLSLLPKNFDYYAGGHVHIVENKSFQNHKNVVYPGPLFPNSFSEVEKLNNGGFYIYDNGKIEYKKIEVKKLILFNLDCNNKTPEQINSDLEVILTSNSYDFKDKLVLIRLKGKLKLGKLVDISLKNFIHAIYESGAYFVIKNTLGITSLDFDEIQKNYNPDLIEEEVINEHLGQIKIDEMDHSKEKDLINFLINQLSHEKNEGETNSIYEDRILKDITLMD